MSIVPRNKEATLLTIGTKGSTDEQWSACPLANREPELEGTRKRYARELEQSMLALILRDATIVHG